MVFRRIHKSLFGYRKCCWTVKTALCRWRWMRRNEKQVDEMWWNRERGGGGKRSGPRNGQEMMMMMMMSEVFVVNTWINLSWQMLAEAEGITHTSLYTKILKLKIGFFFLHKQKKKNFWSNQASKIWKKKNDSCLCITQSIRKNLKNNINTFFFFCFFLVFVLYIFKLQFFFYIFLISFHHITIIAS